MNFNNTTNLNTNLSDKIATSFNPKRAGTKTSHVVFVLDDSASMQSCREQTISGFNEFLTSQIANDSETGIKTYITLVKFDGGGVSYVYKNVRAKEVAPLNTESYNPRGVTNLYDAIGTAITAVNMQLAEQKKASRPAPIITILTDGNENASRVYSAGVVKQMVEKAEGKNWTFMFLGANIDTFAVGGSMGFSAHNSASYSTKNMGATMALASTRVNNMKSARAMNLDTQAVYASTTFSDKEKEDMLND